MITTAFLSMWMSNTACAMVMLPIGQAMAACNEPPTEGTQHATDTQAALMLGIAYAASIGGMATLVGTPPNALFAAYMASAHGRAIGFGEWMMVGLPVAIVLLALAWIVLTRLAFRVPTECDYASQAEPASASLPALSRGQQIVSVIVTAIVLGWLLRPLIADRLPFLTDTQIALVGAVLLFVVPIDWRDGRFPLTWRDVEDIRWDVLLLVGGGLALADGISATGLDKWIGSAVQAAGTMPLPILVLLVIAVVVLLGELASNTAVAALFLPVGTAAAVGLGQAPVALALPIVLASSLGFMLPVATPPNAIVYGTGLVTSRQMLRAGVIMDIAGALVVALAALTLGPLVFASR